MINDPELADFFSEREPENRCHIVSDCYISALSWAGKHFMLMLGCKAAVNVSRLQQKQHGLLFFYISGLQIKIVQYFYVFFSMDK